MVGRAGSVHYYNMYGIDTISEGRPTKAIDMEFLNFITQDQAPMREGNRSVQVVYESDAWRHLLCKDVFFKQEQEFRLILPEEKINGGNLYEVDVPDNVKIMDLDEFLSQMK